LPGGRQLVAFGVETWGRLGAGAEAFLGRLSAAASRRAYLHGLPPSRVASDVRAKIDAHIHRCAVQACEWAVHALPGQTRRTPLRLVNSHSRAADAAAPAGHQEPAPAEVFPGEPGGG
jgi:hypothetical protein